MQRSRFLLTGLLLAVGIARVQAANILIVAGTTPLAQTAANVLNADLGGTNTVTIVNTGVPVSLAGFTQIYDVRFDNNPAFTPAEMNQYVAFLNAAAGNTIFLMGENVGFNARNTPINQFIGAAGGGGIPTLTTSSTASETVVAPLTGPNAITTVTFAACGLATTAGFGQFASSEAGGGCALFFKRGQLLNAPQGALVVVYDVNFIATAPDGGAVNEIPFRLNMEAFIAAPTAGAPNLPPPTAIPTLSVGGMMIMAFMLCGAGALMMRRRGFA
jgi:hypothetical protein